MKFELDYFGEVIEKELRDKPLNQEFEDYFMQAYLVEQTKTEFKGIMNDAKSAYGQKERKDFVSMHQNRLIHYADEVMDIMKGEGLQALIEGPDEPTRINLCRYVFNNIEELIISLERNFPDLFDNDTTVPEAYNLKMLQDLEKLLPTLTKKLKKLGCDVGLMHAATEPLAEFVFDNRRMIYSYRNLHYINLLVGELRKVTDNNLHQEEPRKVLFKRLCIINLNSDMFYEYITGKCQEKLNHAAHPADRELLLIRMIKQCEQTKLMDGTSLNPESASIKQTVMGWLMSEQAALQAEAKVKERYGEAEQKKEVEDTDDYKLPVSLTDGQLAYLVRLLVQFKIITEKTRERIFRFFSEHFITKKDKDTGRFTFKNRYNDPSQPAKLVVKELLQKMWRSVE